jgi:hypothetical protein
MTASTAADFDLISCLQARLGEGIRHRPFHRRLYL